MKTGSLLAVTGRKKLSYDPSALKVFLLAVVLEGRRQGHQATAGMSYYYTSWGVMQEKQSSDHTPAWPVMEC